MKRILSTAILGCFALATASAFAGEGYLVANVTLRAGPDLGYPSVVRLRAGTPVGIEGCVDGWSWCDVTTGVDRGWVPANYLQEEYQGRRVLVPAYGVQIGIPIVTFVFGSYWDNYYHDRSWYGNREHWSNVQPHYSSYGGSHGTAYGSSYGGSHGTSYGGSSHYVAPNQAQTSSTYRTSGSRQATVVTTQPTYQTQHTQPTYQASHTQPDSQATQTKSVAHGHSAPAESHSTQSYANHSTTVEHDGGQSGAQAHGANTQHRSSPPNAVAQSGSPAHEAGSQHQSVQSNGAGQHNGASPKTVAEHKPQASKAPHKDAPAKSDSDHGGGKDKNQD